MAFIANLGSTPANPMPAGERYLLLAHPSVTDVLVLNTFAADGNGYKPSKIIGLLSATDRTLQSIVAVQASYKKTQWPDLAFVMTRQQVDLFNLLVLTQTPASPITLSDVIEQPYSPISKNVIVESPGNREVYGNLSQFLVQFSALEV